MSSTGLHIILLGVLLVMTQAFCLLLTRAAQQMRLRLAEQGEQLLGCGDLTPEAARHVKFLLSTAFGMRFYLILSVFIVPAMAAICLLNPKFVTDIDFVVSLTDDAETTVRFRNLCRTHHLIIQATNPVLYGLVSAEIASLVVPVLIVRSAFAGALALMPTGGAIINIVSEKIENTRQQTLTWGRHAAAV